MQLQITALTKPEEIRTWMLNIAEKEAVRVPKRLAEMAEIAIKMWILNTSKKPTGALADAFFKEQLGKFSWGVGNIEYLNNNAPMWRHINFGSTAINANWQHILPKGHWEDGRWVEGDEDGDYFAVPNTPIQAHNYIEKTIADMELAIQQVLAEK